jgi:hypothetical protein
LHIEGYPKVTSTFFSNRAEKAAAFGGLSKRRSALPADKKTLLPK